MTTMRVGETLLMYGLVTWHLLIDMSLLTGAPTIIITAVRRRIENDLDDRAFSLITLSGLRRTTKVPNQRHLELEIQTISNIRGKSVDSSKVFEKHFGCFEKN